MRPDRARTAVLAAVALALVALAPAHRALAITSSVERATSSVVAITSYADRIGTGVVIAPDRVLTVAHVVDAAGGTPSQVIAEGALYPYEVLAIDRERDLALLAADLPDSVPAIVWGDDTSLALGDDVIAIGFPIGLTSVTLSKGVVSSPRQVYAGSTYIQTDAAINPGNSGGPLVDSQGRLVGLTVAKVAEVEVDAVGFAVPAADVTAFLAREAPDITILRDTASGATPAEVTAAGAQAEPPQAAEGQQGATGGNRVALALAIGLPAALVLAALVRARRRAVQSAGRMEEAPEPDAQERKTVPRAVFRVSSPAEEREFDLRLPSVAGSAPNADMPLHGEHASAYHVRFSPAGDGVTALDLTDGEGMYCADACVSSALLVPGESVRVAGATITLVRVYEA